MQFVSRLAVSAVATSHSVDSGDWSDWECPGFPCFIVNYYEFREHDDPKQVCTPVSDFTACSHLANAEDFAANKTVRYNWTNHVTTLGWHRMKGKKHQCGSVDYKCTEVGSDGKPRCPNSNVKCRSNCKKLNLLDLYMARCNKQCDYLCPDGAPVPSPPTPMPSPTPTAPTPTPTPSPNPSPEPSIRRRRRRRTAPTPAPPAPKPSPSPEPSIRRRRRRTAPTPAPAPAPKPSPSDGLNKCTQGCMAVDTKHFNSCEEDGTTDCSSSKCCNENGARCYVKNQYWSACQLSCDPSKKDPFDGQHWQCSELTPRGCTSLRSCVDGCESAHAPFSATLNSTRAGCVTECRAEDSKAAHGLQCEADGTTDCSSSRCCQDPDAKCMRKNQYWSACVKVCRPGHSDDFDGQPWECKDRTKMPSCASFRRCLASC